MLSPVIYIPHGGGPLPLLGHAGHIDLVNFLTQLSGRLGAPSAILVISAHWEEDQPTLTSSSAPEMLYDYGGFPEECYHLSYPAPGAPALAESIRSLLADEGLSARLDDSRGYDHGLFVPLMLSYPEARIPCLQLSLLGSLDPAEHIKIGRILAGLREQDVLVIGSGMSYHNMGTFFSAADGASNEKCQTFDNWLITTCCGEELSPEVRQERLLHWWDAPHGPYCHPRQEHLLPLHVCYGIAAARTPQAELVFNNLVMGKRVSAFLWQDGSA